MMVTKEVVILIAEDDDGHVKLIQKNLKRAGLLNPTIHFKDGQETLDFLYGRNEEGPNHKSGNAYLLLLDIRMPKVDGVEVLKQLKEDPEFRKIPVVMLTTADDPREIENCHNLGCSNYIVKPVAYEKFHETIQQIGLFFTVVEAPKIDGEKLE